MGEIALRIRMLSATILAGVCAAAVLLTGVCALVPTVAEAQFGIASFGSTVSTSQAGAHPDLSTSFALNTDALGNPIGQIRNATVTLPPGMIGNPRAIETCSAKSFATFSCEAPSQVGVLGFSSVACQGTTEALQAPAEAGATTLVVANANAFCTEERSDKITIGSGASAESAQIASIVSATTLRLLAPLQHPHAVGEDVTHLATISSGSLPLFNIQPSVGHLATFATSFLLADIFVQVDMNKDGQLTATISEAPTLLSLAASSLTLWGVPASPGHNSLRCKELITEECGPSKAEPAPFVTNPTACAAPLETGLTVTTWQGQSASSTATLPVPTGCEKLTIEPSIGVAPDTTQRDTPVGYDVELKVPQQEEPYGLATAAIQNLRVTLPAGASLSPGLANGLQACTDAQLEENGCPNASRIGTAAIISPLLPEKLTGSVFIGTPTPSEKYRVFVRVSAENAVIDLRGQAVANEATGQVTAVFDNVPQLPFSALTLDFFGGPSAAFVNPATCGPATSSAQIVSYAGQTVSPSSTFTVDNDDAGGACPPSQPFAPSFSAGTTDPVAGGFSPFTLTASRNDGEQSLSSFTAQLPSGLAGLLSSVPLCPEPQAREGSCPQSSEVGTATIGAGAGPQQLYVSGPVYLTGPYDGAPFGLSVVVKVSAGPFELGTLTVRSRILVNPTNLALSVVSDPFPQILGGIQLRLRTINLTLGRSGFIFNPTDCSAQTLAATIVGSEGASVAAAAPFGVAGCQGLSFAPKLTASTRANATRFGHGASLDVTVSSRGGPPSSASTVPEANLRSVTVQMPKQLQARLETLQLACRSSTFLLDPASCPTGSVIGTGTVRTPMLSSPLAGPVYLVSHGSTAFPSLAMMLQGGGIAFTLDGTITISKSGVISSAFKTLPDVPITLFDLNLSEGPHSVFGAIEKLCSQKLSMPTTIEAANGKRLTRGTTVAVTGCPKPKGAIARRLRRLRAR